VSIKNNEIWFWQRIVTPHMVGLAQELSALGFNVNYVAEQVMHAERLKLGWEVPSVAGVKLHIVESKAKLVELLQQVRPQSVHICQGIRSNGFVMEVQAWLKRMSIRYWVIMETVDDRGLGGIVKRLEYRRLFYLKRNDIKGVLAIGHRTTDWLISRGVDKTLFFRLRISYLA
jgi:hypothetical protein